MNRADFQQLADLRIEEAAALLAAQKWDGAYYLVGYAVECALKACIARRTNQYDFADKETTLKSYSHDFGKLLECADLESLYQADITSNGNLFSNWAVAKKWKETSRYERRTEVDAKSMYNAIVDPTDGVLPWLKKHW